MSEPNENEDFTALARRVEDLLKSSPELESILNWKKLSKYPFTIEFMRYYHHRLMWDMVSLYHPLSIEAINEFDRYLRYDLVSRNKNLSTEVLREKMDVLDFDIVQVNQTFTSDLIDKFWEQIDPVLIIKHQKNLQEETIIRMMDKLMPVCKAFNQLVNILSTVIKYQSVSERFIMAFADTPNSVVSEYNNYQSKLPLEKSRPFQAPKVMQPGIIWERFTKLYENITNVRDIRNILNDPETFMCSGVLSLDMVATYQKVSEFFIETYLLPEKNQKIADIVASQQKMSIEFIIAHKGYLPLLKLLKCQDLPQEFIEDNIYPIMEDMKVPTLKKTVETILRNQNINGEFANRLITKVVTSVQAVEVDLRDISQELWQIIFLRITECADGSSVHSSVKSLDWHDRAHAKVQARINWMQIAKTKLSAHHVNLFLQRFARKIPLYTFLRYNPVTIDQVKSLESQGLLGPMEWWSLLTAHTKKLPKDDRLPDEYISKMKDRLNWWKYTDTSTIAKFYEQCLQAIKLVGSEYKVTVPESFDEDVPFSDTFDASNKETYLYDLRKFLHDFVKDADWGAILRYEKLDEWFIRLFSNFADKIDMFWWKVARYQTLNRKFIETYVDRMDINILIGYQQLPMDLLESYSPFFEEDAWDKVAKYQKLTIEFMRDHKNSLPEEFLKKNAHIDADDITTAMKVVSENQKLTIAPTTPVTSYGSQTPVAPATPEQFPPLSAGAREYVPKSAQPKGYWNNH